MFAIHQLNKVTIKWFRLSMIAVLVLSIAVVIVLTVLRYSDVLLGYKLYHIPSKSMMPALFPNDFVMVDILSDDDKSKLQKGDVVVFNHPYKKNATYIKRLSYLSGERFLGKELTGQQVAVLGDNSDESEDSRYFGAIDRSLIIGRAEWIVLSLSPADSSPRWQRMGTLLSTANKE